MSQMQDDPGQQQENTAAGTEGMTPEASDREFDEGFDIQSGDEAQGEPGTEEPGPDPENEEQPAPQEQEQPQVKPSNQEVHAPGPQVFEQPQAQPAPQEQEQSEEPKQLESVPEEIADELKELQAISPEAAKLAMEDSPEGASVRERLVNYGAPMAQDRAEFVLARRDQAHKEASAEAERNEAARRAHNENFLGAIKRELPDYYALIDDPARKAEAAKYQQEVFSWIGSKPYSEAAPLMEIARFGRDVNQVVSLLKQFESERRGGKKAPDPTGALAVPGRGAPTAPAGIGDKDDFDAGWDVK